MAYKKAAVGRQTPPTAALISGQSDFWFSNSSMTMDSVLMTWRITCWMWTKYWFNLFSPGDAAIPRIKKSNVTSKYTAISTNKSSDGVYSPFSRLLIWRSLIFSASANCSCVIFLVLRSFWIRLPVSNWLYAISKPSEPMQRFAYPRPGPGHRQEPYKFGGMYSENEILWLFSWWSLFHCSSSFLFLMAWQMGGQQSLDFLISPFLA